MYLLHNENLDLHHDVEESKQHYCVDSLKHTKDMFSVPICRS